MALAFGCNSSTPPASSPETAASQVVKPVEVAQSASSPVADVSQPAQTEASLEIKIGYEVGNRGPDIEFTLDDGRTLTSKDLLDEGKPVFLFFTASW